VTSRVGTTSALIAAIPFASHLSRLINAAQYTRDVLNPTISASVRLRTKARPA